VKEMLHRRLPLRETSSKKDTIIEISSKMESMSTRRRRTATLTKRPFKIVFFLLLSMLWTLLIFHVSVPFTDSFHGNDVKDPSTQMNPPLSERNELKLPDPYSNGGTDEDKGQLQQRRDHVHAKKEYEAKALNNEEKNSDKLPNKRRNPWDPPEEEKGWDLDHLPPNITGAFANCTAPLTVKKPSSLHPDQKNITVSCHTIHYRMPQVQTSERIFIGVLSAANGEGPERRQSIRDTWAQNHSVFFLVAGPWHDIEEEYKVHRDLIWLDEEETYNGEKSVLTFKTLAFMKIVHVLSTSQNLDIRYAFKTDDDSFVNVEYLHRYLLEMQHNEEYNYWGWCQRKMFKPLRGKNDKWAVSYETYPESHYPRYCQGAGFALSWKFINCAAGQGDHIANARFMPFEDVATGLIAQRCGIVPSMVEDPRLIHMYRTDRTEERERVNQGLEKISKKKLPIPDMEGRIVQHRIYDSWDMKEHYKQVLDPEGYRKNTDVEWYYRKEDDEVE
jgi:beta-1,3-galactosyltransferase 1